MDKDKGHGLILYIYVPPYNAPPAFPPGLLVCQPTSQPGRIPDCCHSVTLSPTVTEGPAWAKERRRKDVDKEDLGGGLGAVLSIYDFMIWKIIFVFFGCKIKYVSTGMSRQSFHTCSVP